MISNYKVVEVKDCVEECTYGYLIVDELINVDNEIYDIKHNENFISEFTDENGVPTWCIEDIFERFDFEWEWFPYHWNDTVAYI